jgi:L,D-transpeptidase YbiS
VEHLKHAQTITSILKDQIVDDYLIDISLSTQCLTLYHQNHPLLTYSISTALKGAGEDYGSYQTPRGWHVIRAKIGGDQPIYTVFEKRRPTGQRYSPELKKLYPDKDWITTRILWLCGLTLGQNRLGKVDTMQRKIYIHGTGDEADLGQPLSHGCIRMGNQDILTLFERVPLYTLVWIH